jgi:uncharacterized membrane protein
MNLFGSKYFSKEDLQSITRAIAAAERSTGGEIRVVVRHRRHWKERKLSLHELTLGEFHRLGMQNTRERIGVLILLLLSERQFQIIADEGIHRKVGDGTWNEIAAGMTAHFKSGNYLAGILEAVGKVGDVLHEHFPGRHSDGNELPDDVVER